jgi:universal stress protein A
VWLESISGGELSPDAGLVVRTSSIGITIMKVTRSKKPGKVVMELGRSDAPMLAASSAAASPISMKTILVPVDFSECSEKALVYARGMAKQFGARIVLLHVVELSYSYADMAVFDYASIEKDLRVAAETRLRSLAKGIEKDGTAAAVEIRLGRPAREVAECAKKLGTDLIIISTHGYTGLKHVLLGSTAETIVRHAPCPVLVVRPQEHEFLKT